MYIFPCKNMIINCLPCLFILVLSCYANTGHALCNQLDRNSLLSFSSGISASPPLRWSVLIDCCLWEGVGCDANGRVTKLWLPSRGLSGTISAAITNLTHLSQLSLAHNLLSGQLPDRLFWSLNQLEIIDLGYNSLYGPLESSDKLPSTIKRLDLSSNNFHGTIQSLFLRPALNLISFNVSNNGFNGPLPSKICGFSPSITLLDVSSNNFNSSIPHGFGRCSRLKVLRAGFNEFSGSLPGDIYSASTLQELSLPGNHLSGPLGEPIVNHTQLRVLALYSNELTGGIPTDIGRLSNLEQLLLHENKLNGTLPSSLRNCTRITTLNLRVNLLAGELSAFDFSKFFRLRTIDLGNNFFTGSFPVTLAWCTSLTSVRLSSNELTGEIPPEIQAFQSLSFLSMSNNTLTNIKGAINNLGGCKSLKKLILSRNFYNESLSFDGSILLRSVDAFQNLRVLSLGACKLRGQVPIWLTKLGMLEGLDLSKNELTGPIPKWLGTMPNLFYLDLSGNLLFGGLPIELMRLPGLATQQGADQVENNELPMFMEPDNFTYFEFNRLFNLVPGIHLGNNNLKGSIPVDIGQLKFLHLLNLSNNHFSGNIPESISKLTTLEALDLSGNSLSGEIPSSLRNLHFLSHFSLANNNLIGPIPTGGQFDTFGSTSFEGNLALCGEVLQRPCSSNHVPTTTSQFSRERKSLDKETIVFWLIFGISFGISFSVSFVTSGMLSRKYRLLGSRSRCRYVFFQL